MRNILTNNLFSLFPLCSLMHAQSCDRHEINASFCCPCMAAVVLAEEIPSKYETQLQEAIRSSRRVKIYFCTSRNPPEHTCSHSGSSYKYWEIIDFQLLLPMEINIYFNFASIFKTENLLRILQQTNVKSGTKMVWVKAVTDFSDQTNTHIC